MFRLNALFVLLIASGVDRVTPFNGGFRNFLRGDPLDFQPQTEEDNRIINGQDATVNEYPFYCDIRSGSGKGHWCGGTLLPSGQHVLTAAHCLMGAGGSPNYVQGIMDGEVWCNAHSVTTRPAVEYVRTVTSIHFYDNSNTRKTEYPDAAILTLSSPITAVNQFLTCNEDANIPGTSNYAMTHIGMGTINQPDPNVNTYELPDVLQEVTLYSTTCPYGASSPAQWVLCAHDNEAGVVRNGCRGDSGSALFDINGFFIGLDSFGTYACDYPTGFTRASSICTWACTYDSAFCSGTSQTTSPPAPTPPPSSCNCRGGDNSGGGTCKSYCGPDSCTWVGSSGQCLNPSNPGPPPAPTPTTAPQPSGGCTCGAVSSKPACNSCPNCSWVGNPNNGSCNPL